MKKLILLVFIFLFLISNVNASPIATIGIVGLNFINPTASTIVSNALCVVGPPPANLVSCAAQYVGGKVVGQVYGEALNQIAQESPEAAQAIITYNKIKGYIDSGANIMQDLEVNEEGKIEKGMINFEEGSGVGDLLGFENEDDVFVENVDLEFNGEEGHNKITFKEKGRFWVKQNEEMTSFENIKEGGEIELNNEGEIIKTDFITNENGGNYNLGNNIIMVPPNSRVRFNGEKIVINAADNSQLTNLPRSILNENIETKVVEFRGNNLKLPNEIMLERGTLNYHNNQFYVEEGKAVTLNGINIKPFKEKVDIHFDGRPHLGDYVSFDKTGERSYFMVKDNPYEVSFESSTNIFNVEGKDNLKFIMEKDAQVFIGHLDDEHVPFITYGVTDEFGQNKGSFQFQNGNKKLTIKSDKEGHSFLIYDDLKSDEIENVKATGSVPLSITGKEGNVLKSTTIFTNDNEIGTIDNHNNLRVFSKDNKLYEKRVILLEDIGNSLDEYFEERDEDITSSHYESLVSQKNRKIIRDQTKNFIGDVGENTKVNLWSYKDLHNHPGYINGEYPDEWVHEDGSKWRLIQIDETFISEVEENSERNFADYFSVYTLNGRRYEKDPIDIGVPQSVMATAIMGERTFMNKEIRNAKITEDYYLRESLRSGIQAIYVTEERFNEVFGNNQNQLTQNE